MNSEYVATAAKHWGKSDLAAAKMRTMTSYCRSSGDVKSVPDPYYGGPQARTCVYIPFCGIFPRLETPSPTATGVVSAVDRMFPVRKHRFSAISCIPSHAINDVKITTFLRDLADRLHTTVSYALFWFLSPHSHVLYILIVV